MSDPRIADDVSDYARAHLERFLSGELPPAHIAMGIRPDLWVKSVSKGHARFVWPNDGSRDIGSGRVFGGWIAGLSDNVVSLCMASALEEGEAFTTQDLQLKIFRPVQAGDIEIVSTLKNRSRTTGYVEAEWRLPNGKLAATALAWKAIRPTEAIHGPRP